jgi:hypothetical protein
MSRIVLVERIAIVWLTTIPAVPTAPTQAELTAGVDLVGDAQEEELAEVEGFQVQHSTYPTPGFKTFKVGNVAGDQVFPDSRFAFYFSDTVSVIRTALAEPNTGWIAMMLDGQASGEEVELFPSQVASNVRRKVRDAANIFDVNFSIAEPFIGTQAA